MPAICCGFTPMILGSKAIKHVQGKTSQITKVYKNQRKGKGSKHDSSSPSPSACTFMLMMELRKKIITFRDIIDLPPCNTSLSTDQMIIRTMQDLHKYYPESIPRYNRKKFRRLPLDTILMYFYKALQDLADMSNISSEGVNKCQFDLKENEDCKNVEKLVEIVVGTLNGLIKMAREKSDMVNEDEENKGLGPKGYGYPSPTSVLPEYMDGSLKPSCASPLVLAFDVQSIRNLSPADLKQLKLHMIPGIEQEVPSFLKRNKIMIEEHNEEENGGVVDETRDSNNQNETSEDQVYILDNTSGDRTTDGSNVAPTTLPLTPPSEVKPPEFQVDIEVAEDKSSTPAPETLAEVVGVVVEDVSTPQQLASQAEVLMPIPPPAATLAEVVEDVSTPIPPATTTLAEVVEDVSTPQPAAAQAEVLMPIPSPAATLAEVVEDVSTPQPPPAQAEVLMPIPPPAATLAEVVEDVSTPIPPATTTLAEVVEDVSTPQPAAAQAEVLMPIPSPAATLAEVVEDVSTPQPPPAQAEVLMPIPPPATTLEEVVEDVSTPQPQPPLAQAQVLMPIPPPAVTLAEVVEVVEDVSTSQPPPAQEEVLTLIPPPTPPLLQPNVASRKPPTPPPQPNAESAKPTLVEKVTELPSQGSTQTKAAETAVLSSTPQPPAPSKPNIVATTSPTTTTPAPLVMAKGGPTLPPPPPTSASETTPPPPIPIPTSASGTTPPPPPPPPTSASGTTPPPPIPIPTSASGTTPQPPPTSASKTTPPPPIPIPTSASGTTPPPPPPTSASGTTPPPPNPIPTSASGTTPPPPPIPRSGSGTAPPPPPPTVTSKGSGSVGPPASSANGPSPPPPAPGTLRVKKAASKLKRSSHMGNLYRTLKGKVEGVPVRGTPSSNGKKSGGGNNGGGKQQGMADALLEMTKRSKHYIQIEEDVQKYEKSIKELRTSISTFKTNDMAELLKFHKYVESILENLADETQVLARFEGFPDKKLEALRIASALYSKLDSMLSELQNWKIEPPLAQLLDKVERYFDKIKTEIESQERNKDAESKKLKGHNIEFDFQILVRIKEAMVDVSSNCMELALKERKETKLAENEVSKTKGGAQKKVDGKLLWRAFQFAFRVYTFAGGHDDRADKLTRELAHEIENDPELQ